MAAVQTVLIVSEDGKEYKLPSTVATKYFESATEVKVPSGHLDVMYKYAMHHQLDEKGVTKTVVTPGTTMAGVMEDPWDAELIGTIAHADLPALIGSCEKYKFPILVQKLGITAALGLLERKLLSSEAIRTYFVASAAPAKPKAG